MPQNKNEELQKPENAPNPPEPKQKIITLKIPTWLRWEHLIIAIFTATALFIGLTETRKVIINTDKTIPTESENIMIVIPAKNEDGKPQLNENGDQLYWINANLSDTAMYLINRDNINAQDLKTVKDEIVKAFEIFNNRITILEQR